jgi:hypothetical protein
VASRRRSQRRLDRTVGNFQRVVLLEVVNVERHLGVDVVELRSRFAANVLVVLLRERSKGRLDRIRVVPVLDEAAALRRALDTAVSIHTLLDAHLRVTAALLVSIPADAEADDEASEQRHTRTQDRYQRYHAARVSVAAGVGSPVINRLTITRPYKPERKRNEFMQHGLDDDGNNCSFSQVYQRSV